MMEEDMDLMDEVGEALEEDTEEVGYWAWHKPSSDDYGQAVITLFQEEQAEFRQSDIWVGATQALSMYLNRNPITGVSYNQLSIMMVQGEPVATVNEFRQLIDQIQSSVMDAFEDELLPVADNSDATAAKRALVGTFILKAERQKPAVKSELTRWGLMCSIIADAWLMIRWDPKAGKVVPNAEGQVAYEGKPITSVVDRSHAAVFGNPEDPDAFMYVDYVNKFELSIQYPDHAEVILEAPELPTVWDEVAYLVNDTRKDDDNLIPVLRVFHAQRAHVPSGRLSIVLGDGTVIQDEYGEDVDDETGLTFFRGLTTSSIPVSYLAQGPALRGDFPHPVNHELITTSKMVMAAVAKIAQKMRRSRSITSIPVNASYTLDQLRDDGVIRANENEKPTIFELSAPTDQDRANYEFFKKLGEQSAVIASASRGQSEGDSGVHANLLTKAQAKYAAGLAGRAALGYARWGEFVLQLYANHAETPRLVTMVGLRNMSEAMEFTGGDLRGLSQVTVINQQEDNFELAEKLISMGVIAKDDYPRILAVVRGGFAYAVEDAVSDKVLISEESEYLMSGEKELVVMPSDDHRQHLKAHLMLLSSNEARYSPEIRERILAHCRIHISALTPDDPMFADNIRWVFATEQKPLPTMEQMMQSAQQPAPMGGGEEKPQGGSISGLGKAMGQEELDKPSNLPRPGPSAPKDLAPDMKTGPVNPQGKE